MKLLDAAETLENSLEEEKQIRAPSCPGCPGDECGAASLHETLWLEEIPANRKALREAIAEARLSEITKKCEETCRNHPVGEHAEHCPAVRPFESVTDFELRGLDQVVVTVLLDGHHHTAWYKAPRFYIGQGSQQCYMKAAIGGVRVRPAVAKPCTCSLADDVPDNDCSVHGQAAL